MHAGDMGSCVEQISVCIATTIGRHFRRVVVVGATTTFSGKEKAPPNAAISWFRTFAPIEQMINSTVYQLTVAAATGLLLLVNRR